MEPNSIFLRDRNKQSKKDNFDYDNIEPQLHNFRDIHTVTQLITAHSQERMPYPRNLVHKSSYSISSAVDAVNRWADILPNHHCRCSYDSLRPERAR